MFRSRLPGTLIAVFTLAITSHTLAVEPERIWVDAEGKHTIRARLIDVIDGHTARLLRRDGSTVQVMIDQLSARDQRYLQQSRSGSATPSVLNASAPDSPVFSPSAPSVLDQARDERLTPQPVLDLPPAERSAADDDQLQRVHARKLSRSVASPVSIPADPPLWVFGAVEARIPIEPVDVYSNCSRPIPIIAANADNQPATMLVMSISKTDGTFGGSGSSAWNSRNHLMQFDVDAQRATVAFRHDKSISLLDHHHDSGRSLVHIGYDSLGKGGTLAIASGWENGNVTLSHRRSLEDGARNSLPPQLRWAAWIDEEHVIAVVDQTLGLWNLVSGEQLYGIDGIDPRGEPALSGGRRIIAVPGYGDVHLFTTWDGDSLGRLEVPRQVPGVSFSPQSDQLAIATSRQMLVWDLPAGRVAAKVTSKQSLGTKRPIWIDSEMVLSSGGVLINRSLGVPVWRYDVVAAETASLGRYLVAFRRHPRSELTIAPVPHDTADAAMQWITGDRATRDASQWQLLGRSQWGPDGWDDQDVQITGAATRRR